MTTNDFQFKNDIEVKWCPGCGDHIILKHFQTALLSMQCIPHHTVIVSGIGCASRFPYYMNTYGFHTIHGRALPIATGIKLSKPSIDVWVITGDGDCLSIGANHLIHFFKRNLDINVLLFNNNIYGLTKGQYSPTSTKGLHTKSSPFGAAEIPLNPLKIALNANATFLARTMDRNGNELQSILKEAKLHTGSSFVEILQNCPIFNDGVFDKYTSKDTQSIHTINVEKGKPLLFGDQNQWTIEWNNSKIKKVLWEHSKNENIWIHDPHDMIKAFVLCQLGYDGFEEFPVAFGVFYQKNNYFEESLIAENQYINNFKSIIESDKYNIL